MSGLPKGPWWIATLNIAARWGTPPWKIAGGTKTLWYVRTEAVRHYEIKRQHKQKRDYEAEQLRSR